MTPTPEQMDAARRAEEEARKREGSSSVLGDTVTGLDAAGGVFNVVWIACDVAGAVGRGVCDAVVGVCGVVGDGLGSL